MKHALFILAIVVSLSGCAADPAPPASGRPGPAAVEVPPASEADPGSGAAETGASGSAARPSASVAANETIALGVDGTTEGELCPGVLRRFEHCAVPFPAENAPFELPIVERPTLLAVTIAVDEPMVAAGCAWAVLRYHDGASWVSQGEAGKIALGASPLRISWSLSEYPPSARFHVAIYCGQDRHPADGTVTLYAGWAAPFRLEGTLSHERP